MAAILVARGATERGAARWWLATATVALRLVERVGILLVPGGEGPLPPPSLAPSKLLAEEGRALAIAAAALRAACAWLSGGAMRSASWSWSWSWSGSWSWSWPSAGAEASAAATAAAALP